MLIMKRSVILLMFFVALSLTSCDFMRRTAGRPTKKEVEMMKEEIGRIENLRQEEARVRASLDSLKMEKQALQDSITALLATEVPQVQPKEPARDLSQYLTKNLENRYYVIIGAFQSYENAKALMQKADKFGYSPVLIGCRNGLIGVGVCPVDEYADALIALQMLRREKFCPSDPWIYTNR